MKTIEQAEPLRIYDPRTDLTWTVPRQGIRRVIAELAEQWVVNVVVPEAVCHEMVQLPFLRPRMAANGYCVLNVTAFFLRHAAPDWAPLHLGPACQNCAVSIACEDLRSGGPAVWVNHRYSDSPLVEALARLGFPAFEGHLEVERGRDCFRHRQLLLQTSDNRIDLRLVEYPEVATAGSKFFPSIESFTAHVEAAHRGYGPGTTEDHCSVIDFKSQREQAFEPMTHYHGFLCTAWGNWRVDSIFRACGGQLEWEFAGEIGKDREFLSL